MTKQINVIQIDDFFHNAVDEFTTEFSKEMFVRVVNRTPVDNGWLKGSNRLSKGNPKFEEGPVDPSGSRGKSEVANFTAKAGDEIHISNGAPYAAYVELGTQKQRPQPFMRNTAAEAQAIANKVGKEL